MCQWYYLKFVKHTGQYFGFARTFISEWSVVDN